MKTMTNRLQIHTVTFPLSMKASILVFSNTFLGTLSFLQKMFFTKCQKTKGKKRRKSNNWIKYKWKNPAKILSLISSFDDQNTFIPPFLADNNNINFEVPCYWVEVIWGRGCMTLLRGIYSGKSDCSVLPEKVAFYGNRWEFWQRIGQNPLTE